jgi:hypothetical protein
MWGDNGWERMFYLKGYGYFCDEAEAVEYWQNRQI